MRICAAPRRQPTGGTATSPVLPFRSTLVLWSKICALRSEDMLQKRRWLWLWSAARERAVQAETGQQRTARRWYRSSPESGTESECESWSLMLAEDRNCIIAPQGVREYNNVLRALMNLPLLTACRRSDDPGLNACLFGKPPRVLQIGTPAPVCSHRIALQFIHALGACILITSSSPAHSSGRQPPS